MILKLPMLKHLSKFIEKQEFDTKIVKVSEIKKELFKIKKKK